MKVMLIDGQSNFCRYTGCIFLIYRRIIRNGTFSQDFAPDVLPQTQLGRCFKSSTPPRGLRRWYVAGASWNFRLVLFASVIANDPGKVFVSLPRRPLP